MSVNMNSKLSISDNKSLADFIEEIEKGILAVPNFQRDIEWNSSYLADLLDSIFKGFPIGMIVVWRLPHNMELEVCHSIGDRNKGVERNGRSIILVIDGQQRLTLLYSLYTGQPIPKASLVGLQKHGANCLFDPDSGKFQKYTAKAAKEFPHLVSVRELWQLEEYAVNAYVDDYCKKHGKFLDYERSFINECFNRVYSILNFKIPVTEIKEECSLEEVVSIYNKLNRSGKPVTIMQVIMGVIEVKDSSVCRKIDAFCEKFSGTILADKYQVLSACLGPVLQDDFHKDEASIHKLLGPDSKAFLKDLNFWVDTFTSNTNMTDFKRICNESGIIDGVIKIAEKTVP